MSQIRDPRAGNIAYQIGVMASDYLKLHQARFPEEKAVLETAQLVHRVSGNFAKLQPVSRSLASSLRLFVPGRVVAGCADDSEEPFVHLAPGKPIQDTKILKQTPLKEGITEKIQGLDVSVGGLLSTVIFALGEVGPTVILEGLDINLQSPSANHVGLAALRLTNGDSIVAYSRLTGTNEPSPLFFHRIDSAGNDLKKTLVAEDARSSQFLETNNGFLLFYYDKSESLLKVAAYNLAGEEVGRQVINGFEGGDFQVTQASKTTWTLVERVPGLNQIRIFSGEGINSKGAITLASSSLSIDARVSVAIQKDGGAMLIWNSVDEQRPVLRTAFINSSGQVFSPETLFHALVDPSEPDKDFSNHKVVSDSRGNFFVFLKEGKKILGWRVSGSDFANRKSLPDIDISKNLDLAHLDVAVAEDGTVHIVSSYQSTTGQGSIVEDIIVVNY